MRAPASAQRDTTASIAPPRSDGGASCSASAGLKTRTYGASGTASSWGPARSGYLGSRRTPEPSSHRRRARRSSVDAPEPKAFHRARSAAYEPDEGSNRFTFHPTRAPKRRRDPTIAVAPMPERRCDGGSCRSAFTLTRTDTSGRRSDELSRQDAEPGCGRRIVRTRQGRQRRGRPPPRGAGLVRCVNWRRRRSTASRKRLATPVGLEPTTCRLEEADSYCHSSSPGSIQFLGIGQNSSSAHTRWMGKHSFHCDEIIGSQVEWHHAT